MQASAANHPLIGILAFTVGGFAGACFYLPLQRVRQWTWESYWLVYAVVGMVLVPWAFAFATCPNLFPVLRLAPRREVLYCLSCGAVWGVGGLTWGLMIRYLGVGLGLAMGAGLTSAVGTLVPPLLGGRQVARVMFTTSSGIVSMLAALVSLAGIICVGVAGKAKEKELGEEEKKRAVAEFDFRKGIMAAVFAGLMSSAMSLGLQGAPDIRDLALSLQPASSVIWAGMPVLVIVLLGGFVVNGSWCVFLRIKNRTATNDSKPSTPIAPNLLLAGTAGTIWCSQFVCFKAGEPQMGSASYIGWAVLMATQIFFSQLIGLTMGEWKATSVKTRGILATGLASLIASAALAGYAGFLKS